jgi:hypothetical protein
MARKRARPGPLAGGTGAEDCAPRQQEYLNARADATRWTSKHHAGFAANVAARLRWRRGPWRAFL